MIVSPSSATALIGRGILHHSGLLSIEGYTAVLQLHDGALSLLVPHCTLLSLGLLIETYRVQSVSLVLKGMVSISRAKSNTEALILEALIFRPNHVLLQKMRRSVILIGGTATKA